MAIGPTSFGRPGRRALVAAVVLTGVGGGYYYLSRVATLSDERRHALALAEDGHPQQAVPLLLGCLIRAPDDPDLLRALVKGMTRAGAQPEEIEPYTDRWCRAQPHDPEPFLSQLDVRQRLHRPAEDLIRPAEQVLAIVPDDQKTRLRLAGLYFLVGRYNDTVRECNRLLEAPPIPPAEIRVALARAEAARGNPVEAGVLLDRVLGETADQPDALLLRGIVYQQAGEYPRAVDTLRRVRPRNTDERVLLLHHLGQALTRTGHPDEAKTVFDQLTLVQRATYALGDARQRPSDRGLQLRAAETLLAIGEPDEARRVLESFLNRTGPDRAVLSLLAECHDRLGRPDLARAVRTRTAQIP
ncbi:MAG: cellulose synthase subunit BcsC [Gemmataceae bacterium]|nr:cellulose synthase subunit BcsC [Gemmataceae bacterium]